MKLNSIQKAPIGSSSNPVKRISYDSRKFNVELKDFVSSIHKDSDDLFLELKLSPEDKNRWGFETAQVQFTKGLVKKLLKFSSELLVKIIEVSTIGLNGKLGIEYWGENRGMHFTDYTAAIKPSLRGQLSDVRIHGFFDKKNQRFIFSEIGRHKK